MKVPLEEILFNTKDRWQDRQTNCREHFHAIYLNAFKPKIFYMHKKNKKQLMTLPQRNET
jgi:hypothetical protein